MEMTQIAKKLDERLRVWEPEKASVVENLIREIISLADQDYADILRSRSVEQEVLEIIDET
ncbi:hypothetical protein [Desulfonema magnum]|uniref:Uncharacterized protein n=1 Tax=Desulfonema magnum TaxID=45655 RepID=A0A975BG46_9BACT|nr:hypothetical protein [Desulfonema magnum]QTA84445.1 Uncharacterized protein dnm_004410 [Desulfonema magnum]